jgi:hypothetical protein
MGSVPTRHFYDRASGRSVPKPRQMGRAVTATVSQALVGAGSISVRQARSWPIPTALVRCSKTYRSGWDLAFCSATEAGRCYAFGVYIACCAMCGAAAESIPLSVGIANSGDEAAVLTIYRAANGGRRSIESIVGQARQAIADPFRSATGLLSYWRDEAAHGLASTISEIEAHEALCESASNGGPMLIPHKYLVLKLKKTVWWGPNRRRSGSHPSENIGDKSKACF